MLGTGWLRDLDSNALGTADLTDNSLLKAEIEVDASNRLGLGAKYITNPDLDSTVNSMTILQGSYSLDSVAAPPCCVTARRVAELTDWC